MAQWVERGPGVRNVFKLGGIVVRAMSNCAIEARLIQALQDGALHLQHFEINGVGLNEAVNVLIFTETLWLEHQAECSICSSQLIC
jgi:hypothetical protein